MKKITKIITMLALSIAASTAANATTGQATFHTLKADSSITTTVGQGTDTSFTQVKFRGGRGFSRGGRGFSRGSRFGRFSRGSKFRSFGRGRSKFGGHRKFGHGYYRHY